MNVEDRLRQLLTRVNENIEAGSLSERRLANAHDKLTVMNPRLSTLESQISILDKE